MSGPQKITPFLWFDHNAEQAVSFYLSLFKNVNVVEVTRYPENSPGETGTVMTIEFELAGQRFIALNGGPHYRFSPAISFSVDCDTQAELDRLWEKLSEGGEKLPCGWVTDKFGVTWQIVPSFLRAMLQDEDSAKTSAVMQALLKMEKLDLERLQEAYARA